jgi:hypothetical protein
MVDQTIEVDKEIKVPKVILEDREIQIPEPVYETKTVKVPRQRVVTEYEEVLAAHACLLWLFCSLCLTLQVPYTRFPSTLHTCSSQQTIEVQATEERVHQVQVPRQVSTVQTVQHPVTTLQTIQQPVTSQYVQGTSYANGVYATGTYGTNVGYQTTGTTNGIFSTNGH